MPTIQPKDVRYIKLGEGGKWEKECVEKGIVRLGFSTAKPERLDLCRRGRWADIAAALIAEGKTKGTATRFANELRVFFEDDGSTLWLTFFGDRLFWGFVQPVAPEPHPDGSGVFRPIAGGWNDRDINGDLLSTDRLSGALTKLAAYRGTTCGLDERARDYVVRRINGKKTPEVEKAIDAAARLSRSLPELMRRLTPRDFETLVDLVFAQSGWRRLGAVGGTQKTVDFDLVLPSTGEKAFVQVKSRTTPAQLAEYRRQVENQDRDLMFYVFHSGEIDEDSSDDRLRVIGPDKLSEMVMDAGLVSWLIAKVS